MKHLKRIFTQYLHRLRHRRILRHPIVPHLQSRKLLDINTNLFAAGNIRDMHDVRNSANAISTSKPRRPR